MRPTWKRASILIGAGIGLVGGPRAMAITYSAEYINSWTGSGCDSECNSGISSLSYTDDQINMYDSAMQYLGNTLYHKYSDSLVWSSDIIEDASPLYGEDKYYSDDSRMYAYSGHGVSGTSSSNGLQYYAAPYCKKGSSSSCWFYSWYARMGEPSSDPWGYAYPGNLAYLMLLTCYSVDTAPDQQWEDTMTIGLDYVMGYRGTSADSEYTDEVPEDWVWMALWGSPYPFKASWFYAIEDWYEDDTGEVLANGPDSSTAASRRDNYTSAYSGPHTSYWYSYAWAYHDG